MSQTTSIGYDQHTGRATLKRPEPSAWRGRIKADFEYDPYLACLESAPGWLPVNWVELRREKLAGETAFLSQYQ